MTAQISTATLATQPHCHRCRHHVGVFASFCSRLGSRRIPDESKPPEWCPGFEAVAPCAFHGHNAEGRMLQRCRCRHNVALYDEIYRLGDTPGDDDTTTQPPSPEIGQTEER